VLTQGVEYPREETRMPDYTAAQAAPVSIPKPGQTIFPVTKSCSAFLSTYRSLGIFYKRWILRGT
jgi:hypothetical protein